MAQIATTREQSKKLQATITHQSEQLKAILAKKFLTGNLRSSEKVSIFAALTVDGHNHSAGQAVNLLNQ